MRIHGIFRKGNKGGEPVKVFTVYDYLYESARRYADLRQYYSPWYVVPRLSIKWLRSHRQYSVCRQLLRDLGK